MVLGLRMLLHFWQHFFTRLPFGLCSLYSQRCVCVRTALADQVFSAPRYCDFGDNKGAVIRLHAQESGRTVAPNDLQAYNHF